MLYTQTGGESAAVNMVSTLISLDAQDTIRYQCFPLFLFSFPSLLNPFNHDGGGSLAPQGLVGGEASYRVGC